MPLNICKFDVWLSPQLPPCVYAAGAVKSRFRELCMSVHPDKNAHPDASAAFDLLTKVCLWRMWMPIDAGLLVKPYQATGDRGCIIAEHFIAQHADC